MAAGLVPEGRPRPPKQRVFCIFLNVCRRFRANWGNNPFCSRFEGEVQLGFIFGTGNSELYCIFPVREIIQNHHNPFSNLGSNPLRLPEAHGNSLGEPVAPTVSREPIAPSVSGELVAAPRPAAPPRTVVRATASPCVVRAPHDRKRARPEIVRAPPTQRGPSCGAWGVGATSAGDAGARRRGRQPPSLLVNFEIC